MDSNQKLPVGTRLYACVFDGHGEESDVTVWEVTDHKERRASPDEDPVLRHALKPVLAGGKLGNRVSWVDSLDIFELSPSAAVRATLVAVRERVAELDRLLSTVEAMEKAGTFVPVTQPGHYEVDTGGYALEPTEYESTELDVVRPVVMKLLPPQAGKCYQCAVDHEADQPHNRGSLYYQSRFVMAYGRAPGWSDAVAHCPDAVRERWADELKKAGVWTPEDDRAVAAGTVIAEKTTYAS